MTASFILISIFNALCASCRRASLIIFSSVSPLIVFFLFPRLCLLLVSFVHRSCVRVARL